MISWMAVVCAVLSCGGQVQTDDDDDPGTGAPGGEDESGSPGSGSLSGSTRPLGDCVEGFLYGEADGRPCPYRAEDRCYDTSTAACNCICPRDRDHTCAPDLDFDGDGIHEVICY